MLLGWLCADSDWDRPDSPECHTVCEGLRAGKDPLRPTSFQLSQLWSGLVLPRSQSRALSQLHLPFCCWPALLAPCNACTVSVCLTWGRWQPCFTGQEGTWRGNCGMVSVQGSCWRAAGLTLTCSGQRQVRKLIKLCTWMRLVLTPPAVLMRYCTTALGPCSTGY